MPIGKPHISKVRFGQAYTGMKATGIVAEFNPLHNGHVYIMEEARRRTGCDALIVAMSGNFVQRGEPAIIDKWERSESALRCGADLVLEIPTLFSLGNAGNFANAGVRILEEAGCDTICCGSESGNTSALFDIANLIKTNKYGIIDNIAACTGKGLSYPLARKNAVLEIVENEKTKSEASEILSNSNDILALEYMMAADTSEVICIKRKGAAYNDIFDESLGIQSASGIRDLVFRNEKKFSFDILSGFMPEASLDSLKECYRVGINDTSSLLRFAILSKAADLIEECPSGGEGLGNLIKEAALSKESVNEIIMVCKSKRYTYTRLSRLCMQILLGIDRRIFTQTDPLYLRILGFNRKGREVLSAMKSKDDTKLPIITNINKEAELLGEDARKMLALDIKAADIYSLIAGRKVYEHSDHIRKPVIIE